jgi:sugar O-acyltransferase (sialic acid O-acetyltransferase NeuD family)
MVIPSAQAIELYLLGAGGFAREVAWAALHDAHTSFKVAGYLSDVESEQGGERCGIPVHGPVMPETLKHSPGCQLICAVGSPKLKREFVSRFAVDAAFATVIHRSVEYWRPYVTIGRGTIICGGSILTTQVTLGNHVTINLDCTIGHDACIGDYCTLAPGTHISGCVTLEEGVETGTGSCVLPKVRVGAGAVIGAGAVVNKDVPAGAVVVGVPAKPLVPR